MPDQSTSTRLNLRSEEVQDILTAIPHWMIRWGNAVILALIVLFFAISFWVKYPDVIPATATVTTSEPPQQYEAPTSARIDAILVQDRDLIAPQTALAVLESTAKYEDVWRLEQALSTCSFQQTPIYFPFEDLGLLQLGSITAQYLLFENSYRQYRLHYQLQPFAVEAASHRGTQTELQTRLARLEDQQQLSTAELELMQRQVQRDSLLLIEGAIAPQAFENTQLALLQTQRSLQSIALNISQTKEQLSLARLSSGKTSIAQAQEQSLLMNQLLQSALQLKTAIQEWELRYVLRSDKTGRVGYVRPWVENEHVNQGEVLFTIIPKSNEGYVARLQMPAYNSGKVKPGQDVNIQLDHFPAAEFGVLRGTIKTMALSSDEEGLYHIDVNLPSPLVTSYLQEIDLQQELSGNAEIVTEDLRLLQRFFYQFRELLQ